MSSIQDFQAREHLLNALKERDIPIGPEDISWAFAYGKTRDDVIHWVKEYLNDNTLLTKDELHFASNIGTTAHPEPQAGVPILHDQQIQAAIEALQASTAQIEKHAAALEAQRDLITSIQQLNASSTSHHAGHTSAGQLEANLAQELAKLTFDVEESLFSVDEAYTSIDKQNTRAVSSLQTTVNDRLNADDQVLGAMSRLATRTKPPPPLNIDPHMVLTWCETLARLRESEATARVDALIDSHICETLLSAASAAHDTNGTHAQEEGLAAEIASLRAEIGSVVEMVVDATLKRPILKLARASRQKAVLAQHEWLCYVLATLEHMINHLHALSACTDDLGAYTLAYSEVAEAWRQLVAEDGEGTTTTTTSTASRPGYHTAHSSSSSVAGPNLSRTRTNSTTTGASSTAGAPSSSSNPPNPSSPADLAALVFRRFSIPTSTHPNTSSSFSTPIPSLSTLASFAQAADTRLTAQYATATAATAETVGKALDKLRADWQHVFRPIYAFSEYATVRLMPLALEEGIKALDGEIEGLAGALEGVERTGM